MKLSTSLATLALVLGAAAPALSQVSVGAGGGVDAGGQISVDNGGVNAGAGANAGGSLSVENNEDVLGSLNAALDTESDVTVLVRDFDESDEVWIVLVSELEGDADASLKRLIERRSAMNWDLSGSITANASLMAKLQADGHDADDVVAITGNANGSLTIFVEDNQ